MKARCIVCNDEQSQHVLDHTFCWTTSAVSVGEVTFSKFKISSAVLLTGAGRMGIEFLSSFLLQLEVCTPWPASPYQSALTAVVLLSAL